MTLLGPAPSVAAHREADHQALQQRLTVRGIMTPRAGFLCAIGRESVREAFGRVPEAIDALPVVEGGGRHDPSAPILGVIDRRRALEPGARVSRVMEGPAPPLDAEGPILDLLIGHGLERLRLVAGEDGAVVSLVTIHDLARLPLRIAVFAVLTDLEEAVGDIIEARDGAVEAWGEFLPSHERRQRDDLATALRKAHGPHRSGRAVLELDLGLKFALLEEMKRRRLLGSCRLEGLDKVRHLRNAIAHGRPLKDVADVPPATRAALTRGAT